MKKTAASNSPQPSGAPLAEMEYVECAWPWTASGPGWSNSGVSMVIYNHANGERRIRTIQSKDFSREMVIAFRMALGPYNEFERIVSNGVRYLGL